MRGRLSFGARIVAALAVTALAVTGCASAGPSQVGAAAIVGDRSITVTEIQDTVRADAPALQQLVDRESGVAGLPIPPAALAQQSRRLLGAAVQHELVEEQSRRSGVVVDPALVDALLAQNGGVEEVAAMSGFLPQAVPDLVADQIAATEIGREVFDRISVTADYAILPGRAAAEEFMNGLPLGDPGAASARFAELGPSAETAQVLRPGRAPTPGDAAAASPLAYGVPEGGVAIARLGEPEGPGATGDEPWAVVHVIDRTLTAPPPQPTDVPASAVDENSLFGLGLRVLQPLALELDVRVSPRFGAWDPTQLDIVESPAAAGVIRAPQPTAP